jgi:acyl-CoA synthetase (AMP-forming)/AMP-acid ligase II
MRDCVTETIANVAAWMLSAGAADAPAIYCGDLMLTRGQLRARAGGCAARLVQEGLAPGDRVGLLAENSPFFIAAYLGAIAAGACAVPLPIDADDRSLDRMVAGMGLRRILVSQRLLGKAQRWAKTRDVGLLAESSDWPSAPLPASPEIDPRRGLAAMMFTSGSSGEPKGVMVTHANIACNTRDIIDYLALGPQDRVMVVLPLSYCYGMSLLHTHLAAGGSVVLNNRFLFPEKVLDDMGAKQCTGLAGVPATYQILLRKTRFARREFPSLRWLQQAGGKLSDPFLRELRQAFPRVKLFVMYGQTEATARLSYLPPDRLDDKLGSVGRGLPHTRLEVLKPDGAPVRPGSDEVGEIVASGGNITLGYWDDPAETSRFFRQGKLYTGDLARVDRDGFLFIVERSRDFIKAMGNRVSPKEVEEVIAELPQVVETAVIGVPHEMWGEAIKAFVVPTAAGSLTADEVRAHCLRRRLPNYKIPEQVEFLPALPKTAHGKVDRQRLKAEGTGDRGQRTEGRN